MCLHKLHWPVIILMSRLVFIILLWYCWRKYGIGVAWKCALRHVISEVWSYLILVCRPNMVQEVKKWMLLSVFTKALADWSIYHFYFTHKLQTKLWFNFHAHIWLLTTMCWVAARRNDINDINDMHENIYTSTKKKQYIHRVCNNFILLGLE